MNAPDKIYVEVRHPFGNEFTEMLGFENRGNSDDIEYIRKDALVEWIESIRLEYDLAELHDVGADSAMQHVLERINSL